MDFQPHGTGADAMCARKTDYLERTGLVRRRLHECNLFTLPGNDLYNRTEALRIFVKAGIFPFTFRGLGEGVSVNVCPHIGNLLRRAADFKLCKRKSGVT